MAVAVGSQTRAIPRHVGPFGQGSRSVHVTRTLPATSLASQATTTKQIRPASAPLASCSMVVSLSRAVSGLAAVRRTVTTLCSSAGSLGHASTRRYALDGALDIERQASRASLRARPRQAFRYAGGAVRRSLPRFTTG